jgi:hypothetical protein
MHGPEWPRMVSKRNASAVIGESRTFRAGSRAGKRAEEIATFDVEVFPSIAARHSTSNCNTILARIT